MFERCPDCGLKVSKTSDGYFCYECEQHFDENGQYVSVSNIVQKALWDLSEAERKNKTEDNQ